jgi:hypothetical protein
MSFIEIEAGFMIGCVIGSDHPNLFDNIRDVSNTLTYEQKQQLLIDIGVCIKHHLDIGTLDLDVVIASVTAIMNRFTNDAKGRLQ